MLRRLVTWFKSLSRVGRKAEARLAIVLLLLLCLVVVAIFNERGAFLRASMRTELAAAVDRGELTQFEAAEDWRRIGTAALDSRQGGYAAGEARRSAVEWLRWIGRTGRSGYALTQWTLDLAFPFLYGSLLWLLMARAGPACFRRWPRMRHALWLPPLAGAFDLVENALTAALALTFSGADPGGLLTAASWATRLTSCSLRRR